jgi:hypothetical protein
VSKYFHFTGLGCLLYWRMWHAAVFCVDEKTAIQALDRIRVAAIPRSHRASARSTAVPAAQRVGLESYNAGWPFGTTDSSPDQSRRAPIDCEF